LGLSLCIKCNCCLGKPYDELQSRQKRRRRADIKGHMIDSASPLRDIGLEAISVQLQTANGETLSIKLKNVEEESHKDEEQSIQVASSITSTHRISLESYHELSMQFCQLPRSYLVSHVAS